MAMTVARALVAAVGLYLAVGVVFAVPFVVVGLGRVDRTAGKGSVGFRLAILPGVVALWPLLARRWRRAAGTPPEERNPHREEAARLAAERVRGAGAEPGGASAAGQSLAAVERRHRSATAGKGAAAGERPGGGAPVGGGA
jgi:hypothetical protein